MPRLYAQYAAKVELKRQIRAKKREMKDSMQMVRRLGLTRHCPPAPLRSRAWCASSSCCVRVRVSRRGL